jgi:hypothetical protein
MQQERKPTVPEVYALAAALCERAGEGFPETRARRLRADRAEEGARAPGSRAGELTAAGSSTRARW